MRVDVLAPWKIPQVVGRFLEGGHCVKFEISPVPLLFKEITVHVASLESRKSKVQSADMVHMNMMFFKPSIPSLACYSPQHTKGVSQIIIH